MSLRQKRTVFPSARTQHILSARTPNTPRISVRDLSRLFAAYDRGAISRRDVLQVLGLALVAAPRSSPVSRVLSQGRCAGRDSDTTAACVKTPMKAPFKPTGWKTVLLDHFFMRVTDAEREAAFYSAFMGWKVRSNDANGIYMDIGDWGGVIIKGGYTPPARATTAGGGNAGGNRGGNTGGGGAGGGAAAASHMAECTTPRANIAVEGGGALWDGFAWGISP